MILAGDIGGTNSRLAQFDDDGLPQRIKEYPSQRYDTFEQVVFDYMKEFPPPGGAFERACFGVAGPVKEENGRQVVRTTNLKWTIDQGPLADVVHVKPEAVALINDLAANAAGIAALPENQILELAPGERHDNENRAIISAGTGLGVAGLMWDDRAGLHLPVPSEGGHASFGARNELEDDLLRYLREKDRDKFNGHVSWERVLSGPGLFNLFDFLCQRHQEDIELILPQGTLPGNAGRLILLAAMGGTCPTAEAAVELFVSFYGAAAGNVALQFLALGGLYVGGGIAPRIKEKLKGGGLVNSFMDSFLEKGPLKGRVLEKIPVRVILDPHTALRGAGRYALKMM